MLGKRALNVTRGSSERSRDQSRGEPWELTAARLRKAWNRVVKIQHGSPCEPWQDLGSRWLAQMSSINQCHGPVQAEVRKSQSQPRQVAKGHRPLPQSRTKVGREHSRWRDSAAPLVIAGKAQLLR